SGLRWWPSSRPGRPTAAPPTPAVTSCPPPPARPPATSDGARPTSHAPAPPEACGAPARPAGGDALAVLEGAGRDGILGPLAPALSVGPGYEATVAAALGPDADAIVVA